MKLGTLKSIRILSYISLFLFSLNTYSFMSELNLKAKQAGQYCWERATFSNLQWLIMTSIKASLVSLVPESKVLQLHQARLLAQSQALGREAISDTLKAECALIIQELGIDPNQITLRQFNDIYTAQFLALGMPVARLDSTVWFNENYLFQELSAEQRKSILRFVLLELALNLPTWQENGYLCISGGSIGLWAGLSLVTSRQLDKLVNRFEIKNSTLQWAGSFVAEAAVVGLSVYLSAWATHKYSIYLLNKLIKEYKDRGYNLEALKEVYQKNYTVSGSANYKALIEYIDRYNMPATNALAIA